ncbi:DUF6516 family protein [Calditrichota bacterium]
MNLFSIPQEYSSIIKSVDTIRYITTEHISKLQAKVILIDASILRIREVYLKNELIAYSYYWLRDDNSLIMGWDNAPHHKEIKSFPHHRHLKNSVEQSNEQNLQEVLNFIKDFLN